MLCYKVCIDWIRNSNLCKEANFSEGKYQCLSKNSYERSQSWMLMFMRGGVCVIGPFLGL